MVLIKLERQEPLDNQTQHEEHYAIKVESKLEPADQVEHRSKQRTYYQANTGTPFDDAKHLLLFIGVVVGAD